MEGADDASGGEGPSVTKEAAQDRRQSSQSDLPPPLSSLSTMASPHDFPMSQFTESFERCAGAYHKSEADLNLDPDAIEVAGTSQDILNHCSTLTRQPVCGTISKPDYCHYVDVLSSIFEIGGVAGLVICCTIFHPGNIFAVEYSHAEFADFWQGHIERFITPDLTAEAQEIVDNTDLATLLAAAQSEIRDMKQGKQPLTVPKQPRLSRRKSITDFLQNMELLRKLKAALRK